jgi:hypothetical protein
MKTEQNQQELSFEQLLEFNDFSLEDTGNPKTEEVDINLSEDPDNEEEDKSKELDLDTEEKVIIPEKKATPKKEDKEEKISFTNNDAVYFDIIKDRLDSGEWEDVLIETEDGTEKLLSELDSIDKDTFKNLENAIKEQKAEEFKSKYVEIDGLDEVKKRLINIVKSGDLELAKSLFENPESLKEPFQGYDEDNDAHNTDVLGWYYQKIMGHSPSEARALVESSKKDLTLDVKAQKIVEYQRQQFYKGLENKEQELIEDQKEEQERIKEYRKGLAQEFKTEGVSESLTRKFVDVATKKDQNGSFEIDNIYEEWMNDPKKARELIQFMLDKDTYIKKVTSETKKNVQLENLKKIKIVQDTTKVSRTKQEETSAISPLETLNFD